MRVNLIKSYFFAMFIILLLIFFFKIDRLLLQSIIVGIVLFSSILYSYLLKIRFNKINWVSISTIFVFGYIIVFYQIFILEVFGFELTDWFFDIFWITEETRNTFIIIVSLGLLSFFIGSSFSFKNTESKKSSIYRLETKSIFTLLVIAYIGYILFFINSGSYKYGLYAQNDASAIATYFYRIFDIALCASIIVKLSKISSIQQNTKMSIYKYLSYFGIPLLILLGWHILFSLFVGDRGPVIYLTVLTMSLYLIRWSNLQFYKIIIYIGILATFMTIVGEIRRAHVAGLDLFQSISSSTNKSKKSKSFIGDTPLEATYELAKSGRTLSYSIYNVPNKKDYMYGVFQLEYISAIIPIMPKMLNELLFDGEWKYDGSSHLITYFVQGEDHEYGNGTSIVSDLYLDFGVIGVVFGLFFFGLFVGNNEQKLFYGYQKPTFLWVATLLFLANAIYLSRSALLFDFGKIVQVYIFIYINRISVMKLNRAKLKSYFIENKMKS